VPIAFDPAAECEGWKAFLHRVADGNEHLCSYLRRVVGYLLTGSTGEQVLHFLYGLGANGKSVFCEVVAELLGEYAIVVSPELVMAKRQQGIPNDVARLRGSRAALMNETSQGARFDEAKLKDLTGGDTLTGRFLHREFFDFTPTHKLVIRGNHKPAALGAIHCGNPRGGTGPAPAVEVARRAAWHSAVGRRRLSRVAARGASGAGVRNRGRQGVPR